MAHRRGFRVLDFGRTSQGNEGLRRFKLGWGTQETPHRLFQIRPTQRRLCHGRDESSGCTIESSDAAISLSRLIGAAFYRHVA